jgi:outer membrane protein
MAALFLSVSFLPLGLACAAQQGAAASAAPNLLEQSVSVTAGDPCALARSIVEKMGLLAPQLRTLPNPQSFGAANRDLKTVIACRLTGDEAYTYERILSFSGTGLLVFHGDEQPRQVVEALAKQLGLPVQRANPASSYNLPLSYLFPAKGSGGQFVRLTVNAPAEPARLAASVRLEKADSRRDPAAIPAAPRPADPNPPASGAAPGKSIWELYLLARGNDPDLGRSQTRLTGSKADTDMVFAGLLPHVDTSAGMSYIDQTLLNYSPDQMHSGVLGYSYDLTARMPLLQIPTLYNLSASTAGQRIEDAGVASARQSLMSRIADAYFGVLKAQVDQEIARDEISRLKQVLDQAQAFLKAGTGDIISVYEAQARLDSVIADLNKAESTLRLAEQRLSGIVGQQVRDVAGYQQERPLGPEPDDLDWWLSTMEKHDPQVCQAKEGLIQVQLLKKAAKAERLPVIQASAGYNVNKGSAFLPAVETHQWSVGATISMPIYTGGEATARIQRAAANESERGFVLDQVLEQRRDNLRQSFFNLTYNVSLIKALERKKGSVEIQLNAVKKGRSIGTRTAIDLLNAEEAYAMAQRDLKNAMYDNVVRMMMLKSAAGVLAEEDILALAGGVVKIP